jgi:signal peptidase II
LTGAQPGRTGPGPDVRYGTPGDGLVSYAERSFAAGPSQWAALAVVAGAAAVADQVTKALVVRELSLGEEVAVAGPLAIHHVQNTGIAFGLFAGATAIVAVLTGVAIAWMIVVFARGGGRHPVLPVGLGLVIGGAASNLVDRVRLGHVTDYLDVGFWPAFNLADTFIVVGVGVLVAAAVAAERSPRQRGRISAEAPAPRL